MTNDAHDTNVTFAGQWLRSFLSPLLKNSYFMEDTLILVTFDENEEYTIANRKQLPPSLIFCCWPCFVVGLETN